MNKQGTTAEVFFSFLKLGLTSFGGPIAHIAYYRQAFIKKQQWLSEEQFAQLLMLCQILPGPASSQMGFGIGLIRAGWLGGLAAFIAFTAPSAILLFILAQWLPYLSDNMANAAMHGLKLVALTVVAQAVWLMARQLAPDWQRRLITLIAIAFLLVVDHALAQITVVVGGALAGLLLCRHQHFPVSQFHIDYDKRIGWSLLTVFLILLFSLPFLADMNSSFAVMNAFYRAGALVFGGGHVVLPLLEQTVVDPGWVAVDTYLTAYGLAQAVPGPIFSVASYLGALLPGDMGGITGAILAIFAIFLPGFLLLSAILPFCQYVLKYSFAASALAGINASTVGLLAAALYDPIWVSAVQQISDIIIALLGFMMLQFFNLSALLVVAWCLLASIGIALL